MFRILFLWTILLQLTVRFLSYFECEMESRNWHSPDKILALVQSFQRHLRLHFIFFWLRIVVVLFCWMFRFWRVSFLRFRKNHQDSDCRFICATPDHRALIYPQRSEYRFHCCCHGNVNLIRKWNEGVWRLEGRWGTQNSDAQMKDENLPSHILWQLCQMLVKAVLTILLLVDGARPCPRAPNIS